MTIPLCSGELTSQAADYPTNRDAGATNPDAAGSRLLTNLMAKPADFILTATQERLTPMPQPADYRLPY